MTNNLVGGIKIRFYLGSELFERYFETFEEAAIYLKEMQGIMEAADNNEDKALEIVNF